MFIALTAVTTVSAQRKYRVDSPTNVINVLNFICDTYGQKNSQVYSVNKNPNTGIIESKEVITPFVCKKTEPHFTMIADYFHKDEPVSYQLMHIANGNLDNFSIKVATGNGSVKTIGIRTQSNQNMWYMAVKNQDNPQLRDVYAIVWENKGDPENVEGKVFMITSLRPELFEKDATSSPSLPFTIEGHVGYDLTDTLYVFYMADNYEKLNKVTAETESFAELIQDVNHGHVACMPVTKRRFELNVNIDKQMVGRIRSVMPDGSLSKTWFNIDMIPGETYHITTHKNGDFDEDLTYEKRVGRYSGKSMVVNHERDYMKRYSRIEQQRTKNYPVLNEKQTSMFAHKRVKFEGRIKTIQLLCYALNVEGGYWGIGDKWNNLDAIFSLMKKTNHQTEKHFNKFIKFMKIYGMDTILPYKQMLDMLTEQTQTFNDLRNRGDFGSKESIKCQKQVNKLAEKYMNEMRKATDNAH